MAEARNGKGTPASETTNTRRVSAGSYSTSDIADDKDTLGFEPYVQAAVDFVLSEKTHAPLTLSVEGAWGSGKTSFMRQMIRKLRDRGARIVEFNAWRHDKHESLWAAFAMSLVDQLRAEMPWYRRGLAALKLLGLRYDRGAGILPAIRYLLKLILWIVFSGLLVWLWASGSIALPTIKGDKSLLDLIGIVLPFVLGSGGAAASALALANIVRQVVRTVGNPIRHDLQKYFKTVDYTLRVAFVEQFHEDLRKILAAYAGQGKVFVFIDDLDRCEVPHAADLMGAINLLIDVENKLVFILGLDREKVAAGLAVKFESVIPYVKRFDDVTDGSKDDAADKRHLRRAGVEFGYEFIEKFIQLPIRVPAPQPSDLNRFLASLGLKETPARIESRERLGVRLGHTLDRLIRRVTPTSSSLPEGSVEGLPSGEPESEGPSQRDWSRFELSDDRDSDDVLEIAQMVAPAMDYNPRRLIHFMNNFRLRAYTAYRTGLFNPSKDMSISPLRLEQLGKFVAIALRWPLFIYELEEDPEMLQRLAATAEGRAEGEENVHPRWASCRPLLELLAYGTKEERKGKERFTMTSLDVAQLLRVSPAVVPRPAETPAKEPSLKPPSPDQERELATAEDHYKVARRLVTEKRFDEAEKHFKQAAEHDPRSGEIAKDLGDLLKITGRGEEAIKEYIRAREIDPDDPDAYFRRGLLYEEDGVPHKAIVMYEEALEHGASDDLNKRVEQLREQIRAEKIGVKS